MRFDAALDAFRHCPVRPGLIVFTPAHLPCFWQTAHRSIMENHHCALAFEVLRRKDCALLVSRGWGTGRWMGYRRVQRRRVRHRRVGDRGSFPSGAACHANGSAEKPLQCNQSGTYAIAEPALCCGSDLFYACQSLQSCAAAEHCCPRQALRTSTTWLQRLHRTAASDAPLPPPSSAHFCPHFGTTLSYTPWHRTRWTRMWWRGCARPSSMPSCVPT